MTAAEVAKYLCISKDRVYTLTSKKALPHYKPNGGRLLFDYNEINEWLTKSREGKA